MQGLSRNLRKRLSFERLEARTMLAVFYFQDGVYPDSNYDGTRDTQMREDDPYERFGSATSLNVDGDEPASYRHGARFREQVRLYAGYAATATSSRTAYG